MKNQRNKTTGNNMRRNQHQAQSSTSAQVVVQLPSKSDNKMSLLLTLSLVPALALLAATINYSFAPVANAATTNKINLEQRIVDCNAYAKFEHAKGNTNSSVCPAFPPTIDNKDANNNKLIVEGVYDKEHTAKFTVVFDGKTYTLGKDSALASNGNYWRLKLPKLPAPGEYTITATSTMVDGKELTVTDEVVVTDVAPPSAITPDGSKEDSGQPKDKPTPSLIDKLTSTGINIYLVVGAATILILVSIILIIVKIKKKK